MHNEAMRWVEGFATDRPVKVLDLGGRDVNGTPRHLFPNATAYTVLDVRPGPNVDIVADAATWEPNGRRWDLVLATELFEHTPDWPAICVTAFKALWPGGRFVVTTAAPGRPIHSGVDGGGLLHPGEHYENIPPERLKDTLQAVGFVDITVDVQRSPADVRAVATRPA